MSLHFDSGGGDWEDNLEFVFVFRKFYEFLSQTCTPCWVMRIMNFLEFTGKFNSRVAFTVDVDKCISSILAAQMAIEVIIASSVGPIEVTARPYRAISNGSLTILMHNTILSA